MGNNADMRQSGAGVSSIEDHGAKLPESPDTLDFTGSTTATVDPSDPRRVIVNVTGGGGGGGGQTLDDVGLSDKTFSCPTSVSVGDVVYQSAADAVDRASATSTATLPAIGFVITKPTTTSCTVRKEGSITKSGLVPRAIYSVGLTPGTITNDVSAFVTGNVVQNVATAADATTLLLSINTNEVIF